MKKIFYTFLSRPVTAGMFFFSIVFVGVVALFNIPVELAPEISYPKLKLNLYWRGVSPEAMEANITSPVEAELATIKGIKKIKSTSEEGAAFVDMEFHPETDLAFTRIEINEKLSSIKKSLPYGYNYKLSHYVPEEFNDLQGFLRYTVSGNEDANQIRKYLKENVVYKLKAIEGVSDVIVYGGNKREISILIDHNKAGALNVTNYEIQNAVSNAEKVLPAGALKRKEDQLFIKVNNPLKKVELINNLPVKTTKDGNTIYIKDIGKVINGFAEPSGFSRINGKETVDLQISKKIGANTLSVAQAVKGYLNKLSESFPKDYVLKLSVDKSKQMAQQLNELTRSALFSFLIIVLVLLAIFRSIRYSLVIVASIVFSLLFSFLLFYLVELSLNILTIAAFILGFGFMVDNSIVVIDFIDHHYKNNGIRKLTVILKNIFFPVFSSTLTTVAVFVPLLFLSQKIRLYFEQFALGIGFTLFASLIVSFTIIPLCYVKFNFRNARKFEANEKGILFSIYRFILLKIVKFKKLSIVFLILIIGLPTWLIPGRIETPVIGEVYNSIFDSDTYIEIKPYINYVLGGTLNLFFNHIGRGEMWSFGEQTYLSVRVELPNGNRIEKVNELTKKFEKEIIPYKSNFDYMVSRVYNEEMAYIRIYFTRSQSYTSFPYQLKNYLIAYATRLGGLNVAVNGFGKGFYNGGGGSSVGFNLSAMGFNFNKVKDVAADFAKKIGKYRRVSDIDINKSGFWRSEDIYEVTAVINRENLHARNISVEEVFEIIRKTCAGNISNAFNVKNERIDYQIKLDNYNSVQLREMEDLIVKTNKNELVKLKDLVKFKERKVLGQIQREDQQYVRYIGFNVKGPYKYGKKILKKTLDRMELPEGYTLKEREWKFNMDEAESEIWKVLVASIILIFMISSSLFESLKKPGMILVAIPFAIIGSIILFFITDLNLDRGAYAGILLLIGLSVNNSIILVDYLSKHTTIRDLEGIIKLSYTRLRPIFTTTLTTIAALIPLMLNAESTFWKSLSYSITGGIFLSSFFVTMIIPLVYSFYIRKIVR